MKATKLLVLSNEALLLCIRLDQMLWNKNAPDKLKRISRKAVARLERRKKLIEDSIADFEDDLKKATPQDG